MGLNFMKFSSPVPKNTQKIMSIISTHRDLEQHLKDKYGLPDNDRNLRRANSHNSLSQFSPSALMQQPQSKPSANNNNNSSHSKTLIRRKSTGVEPMVAVAKSPVKNLTDLMGGHREPRDSKLRYLGIVTRSVLRESGSTIYIARSTK